MLQRAGALQDMLSHDQALSTAEVADMVWSALQTTGSWSCRIRRSLLRRRSRSGPRPLAAGMNQLQQRLRRSEEVLPVSERTVRRLRTPR